MSETPFYKTRMGHQFYDRTMPDLVLQLRKLNSLLERLSQHFDECYAQSKKGSGSTR